MVVLATALLVVLNSFADVYGSSRPDPLPRPADASRWPAPQQVTDHASTPMVHHAAEVPIRLAGGRPVLEFHVEQEVVDRYGLDVVEEAAAHWSAIPGSRLVVQVADVIDDGVDRNVYDGVNRVFVNRRACERPRLGGAFTRVGDVDERFGSRVGHVVEVNIGLCPHLPPEQATALLVHEIGHGLGFGHLCDPGDPHGCWVEEMGETSHRCRPMYAAITACQTWEEEDEHAVVRQYPRVPSVRGGTLAESAARLTHTLVPGTWQHETVVVVDARAADPLRWSAAALAGALRAPMLVAPGDPLGCVDGDFARELGRLASFGADVLLVGEAAIRCGPQIERWQISGHPVRDIEQLERAAIARLGSDHLVVVGTDAAGNVPFGAAAATAAGYLGAPLIVAPHGTLADPALARLAAERPEEALVVGDRHRAPAGRAAAQLRTTIGSEVAHLVAEDPVAASLEVILRTSALEAGRALFSATDSDDALLAAAHAPLWGAAPVPVDGDVDAAVRRLISTRVREGFVVGDGIPDDVAVRISRAVDGSRER